MGDARNTGCRLRLFPLDLVQQLRPLSPEFFMLKLKFSLRPSNFVETVHIQLSNLMLTCLTKEERFECLKYCGNMIYSKALISWIIKEEEPELLSLLSQLLLITPNGGPMKLVWSHQLTILSFFLSCRMLYVLRMKLLTLVAQEPLFYLFKDWAKNGVSSAIWRSGIAMRLSVY